MHAVANARTYCQLTTTCTYVLTCVCRHDIRGRHARNCSIAASRSAKEFAAMTLHACMYVRTYLRTYVCTYRRYVRTSITCARRKHLPLLRKESTACIQRAYSGARARVSTYVGTYTNTYVIKYRLVTYNRCARTCVGEQRVAT